MELKGTLQSKKGYLYAVIGYKDEAGKQKYKWYATGLKAVSYTHLFTLSLIFKYSSYLSSLSSNK